MRSTGRANTQAYLSSRSLILLLLAAINLAACSTAGSALPTPLPPPTVTPAPTAVPGDVLRPALQPITADLCARASELPSSNQPAHKPRWLMEYSVDDGWEFGTYRGSERDLNPATLVCVQAIPGAKLGKCEYRLSSITSDNKIEYGNVVEVDLVRMDTVVYLIDMRTKSIVGHKVFPGEEPTSCPESISCSESGCPPASGEVVEENNALVRDWVDGQTK